MTIIEKNLPLKMVRMHLDDVPEFALPTGFTLRWYQPGDEADWLRIHVAADRYNEINPALFERQFGPDKKLLGVRQCYLLAPTGEVVGTGTAWFDDDFQGRRWGRVHWMAITPDFQGRGLAKPLLTSICLRLRELGHDRAYLSTSTARQAAIGLYLKFGFEPLIRTATDETLWREILATATARAQRRL